MQRLAIFATGENRPHLNAEKLLAPDWLPTLPTDGGKCQTKAESGKRDRLKEANKMSEFAGQLRLLTPTDCVKDRLAAYFHWKDQQSLEQAVMVVQSNNVNLTEIKRWAANENQSEKFEVFHKKLKLTG